MSRSISPAARRAQDAQATSDEEVVLFRIRHPEMDDTLRISSDPTDLVSLDPYTRGTYSTWFTNDGSPFLFVAMGVDLPADQPDGPQESSFVLDIPDAETAVLLTSTIHPATVDIAVAMRSSPNFVERQWLDLLMSGAEGDGGSIALSFSQRSLLSEPVPADRMTKQRFPGMHR